MGVADQRLKFSLDDFMLWESEQSERHEYINGEVFAMTGARDGHNTIAGNIFAALRTGVRQSAVQKTRFPSAPPAFMRVPVAIFQNACGGTS